MSYYIVHEIDSGLTSEETQRRVDRTTGAGDVQRRATFLQH